MENKKLLMFGILLLFGIFSVIVFSENLSAVGEAIVCCEKIKLSNGNVAWCQETSNENDCITSEGLRSAPTSCESTSYCKSGTCVNTAEGLCMENSPKASCEDIQATGGIAAGLWYDSPSDELLQCQLGCCLIGDQASFTTQTRCKQMSSEYGLETTYRSDIQSESQCIKSATPNVNGACVFEEEFQRTCRFVTREECQNLENSGIGDVEFNAGYLCSADSLGTNCGSSEKTMLLEGRDEVFFMDTCGNPANIYDHDRIAEIDCESGSSSNCGYWEKIVPKRLSCSLNDNLGNSDECGNCNYHLGSTGKLYDSSRDSQAPEEGDNICVDLSCNIIDDEKRDHGETWCVSSASSDGLKNSPGSRDFRKVCYNGEVTIEPCADYRQELCIEDSIGEFSTAACRPNLWQDCVSQDNVKDCHNVARRDCEWVTGGVYSVKVDGGELIISGGVCAPRYAPGFDFWKPETDAASLCGQASNTCDVKYERGLGGVLGEVSENVGGVGSDEKPIEGAECLPGNAKNRELQLMCVALGDCGVSANFIGESGYTSDWAGLTTVTAGEGGEDSGGGGLLGGGGIL